MMDVLSKKYEKEFQMLTSQDLVSVVIGGGIHGIASAICLNEKGSKVILLEKNKGLLQGASGSTHNRAHLGYHYPRSCETALECLRGINYFEEKYPQTLFYPSEAYYLIDKYGSKTTTDEFVRFCQEMKIPCKNKWPSDEFLIKDSIDESFLVPEPVFNLKVLSKLLEEEMLEKGIQVEKESKVVGIEIISDYEFLILVDNNESITKRRANIVINASYAYTNNIQKMFGVKEECMTKYLLQTTEIVVAKSKKKEIPALTVMDGPFMSIMPYAGRENYLLIYDVIYSIAHESIDYFYDDFQDFQSNWELMIEHGGKYFPFFHELEYVNSLWGSRPIPIGEDGDCRKTRLRSHKHDSIPGFYSILEGKFISAFLAANDLLDIIQEDGLIK